MKTLSDTIYYALIAGMAAVGILVLSTAMPIPGQLAVKVVKSGSMEPAIMTGSIVIDKPSASYAVGDVITFGNDTKTQIPTTHRIIATSGADSTETFTVKGDANDAPDPTVVKLSDIRGKVIFAIPYLGYLLAFAKTKLGFFLLVGIPGLVVCIEETMKIIAEVKRLRTKKRPREGGSRVNGLPVTSFGAQAGHLRRPMDGIMPMSVGERSARGSSAASYCVAVFAVLAVSASVFSHASGDTVAYYRSSQSSIGNVLQASATFGPPPAGPTLKFASLSTVGELPDGDLSRGGASSTDPTSPPAPSSSPAILDVGAPLTDASTTPQSDPPVNQGNSQTATTTTDSSVSTSTPNVATPQTTLGHTDAGTSTPAAVSPPPPDPAPHPADQGNIDTGN